MRLTDVNVRDTFVSCLFDEDEDMSSMVKAEGIMSTAGFHPERLEASRENIVSMLSDLLGSSVKTRAAVGRF